MQAIHKVLANVAVLGFLTCIGCFFIPETSFAQNMSAADVPCSNSGSTSNTVSCISNAYRSEDHELNLLYARIQKVLEDDEKANLVSAERLWLQYRDATCDAVYNLYGGGSGGPSARLTCLFVETQSRRENLLKSYGWILQKREQ